ncbi:MAG: hypothetical protein IPP29_10705 [Bacteroidetes bacterium]|nr:hypothetical protein [Bacteroidota bacterium]
MGIYIQWNRNYTDRAYGIALNNSGAYVTGRSAPTTGIDSADYVTLKLNKTTGATIWSDRYNNGLLDRANAIALSTSGNIFVTGESVDAISGSDFATIMYDANGNRKWVTRFDAGINGEDVARNVAVDKSGSIYVSGYATYTSASQADGSLIKYCAPPSISAGSDKTICKGSSTTLNGMGSGTYSWSPATGLSSTSVATPIANPIVSTTYTLTVTNNTGCSASDVVVVTVNNTPVATVTPTGTQTICSGDSLLLTASAGVGNTYQWKKGSANIAGATASTTYVKLAAAYKVVVTNASGCSKTSPVTTLVLDPIAKITAGGPTTFCAGDSVKLNAQTGVGYTYHGRKVQ